MKPEWFEEWFDTPYYHILYKHRDEREAKAFLDRLISQLAMPDHSRMLDLACGRGRHAQYLSTKGYMVTGLDLSEANIEFARTFENENLSFYKHDMRRLFRVNYFDYIFNFFSSFGYFAHDRDHQAVFDNVARGLRSGGIFVLDFLNVEAIKDGLEGHYDKEIDGMHFAIQKNLDAGFIYKTIQFEAKGRQHTYTERIRAFLLEELQSMLIKAGLAVEQVFGNYHLEAFDRTRSPRLIIFARKI